jgi:AraC family transcriptional regulator
LERAAFLLLVRDATILEIAVECGFANHETFTRAFRRRFGVSPRAYRDLAMAGESRRTGQPAAAPSQTFSISSTHVRLLRAAPLAFIRHTGPYESVPDTLFDRLDAWATRRGIRGPRVWMGLGHDAPGITSPERLRFDAALVVPGAFKPCGAIGYQHFEGGAFAVTTHVGPYDSLSAAYATIFSRVPRLRGVEFVGLPAVEIYHTHLVNSRYRLNTTELCLPVKTLEYAS